MNQEATQKPAARPAENPPHTIILRPWPKVIFFYPTMLAAFSVGGWQLFSTARENESLGLVFFTILALNLLVISFEFSRMKTVSLLFLLLAVGFLLLYLGTRFAVLDFMTGILAGLHIRASSGFYLAIGSYLFVIYVGTYINTRWNYFEVRHNEIVQSSGFLGDIRRYPSPNLKFTKEINDVFEFLLLGSGRIILYPASEKEAIVLDNVLNVNRLEREMKKLLSTIRVETASEEPEAAVEER
jgi:hypothetical protein